MTSARAEQQVKDLAHANRQLLAAMRRHARLSKQLAQADDDLRTAKSYVRQIIQSVQHQPIPSAPLCSNGLHPLGSDFLCRACDEANRLTTAGAGVHQENPA